MFRPPTPVDADFDHLSTKIGAGPAGMNNPQCPAAISVEAESEQVTATARRSSSGGRGSPVAVTNATLLTLLSSSPVFLTGAANDLIRRDLSINASAIAMTFTVFWLGSLTGAYVSRRVGGERSLRVQLSRCATMTALALVTMACLPDVGPWFGALLGGLCYGYGQPYTNLLLVRHCSVRTRGLIFGIKQAAIPIATLVASLSIPTLAVPLGWRSVFLIMAVISLGHAVILSRSDEGRAEPSRGPQRRVRVDAYLLGLAAAGLCGAVICYSLGGFLISSLTYRGLGLATASLIAAAASALAAVVRVVSGLVVDRKAGRPELLMTGMFAVGMVGTCCLVAGAGTQQVGALLAYAGGCGWAGLLHYAAASAYPGQENRATAVTQMGVSIGAAGGPPLFGLLFDHGGAGLAWAMTTAVGALGLTASVIAFRARPRMVNQTA